MNDAAKSAIRTARGSGESGFVLILVLWVFILLFVMAFDFSAAVRDEGLASHRYAEEASGYYLAVAGFEHGLFDLLRQRPASGQTTPAQPGDLFSDCSEERLGEGFYRVCLIDEGGKINLNRVGEETLRRIFSNLGLEGARRDVLVGSILDWREQGDLQRVNGAKSDYYLSLSPPYTAKNGPFDSVDELLWVRGVTPEIFYGEEEEGERGVGLKDIFTVDSLMDKVNARTMPPEVCRALTGLTLDKCREFASERKTLSGKTLADVLKLLGVAAGDNVMSQFVFADPSVVSVEAAGWAADSDLKRGVRGVVRLTGGQPGYQLLRWVDRIQARDEGTQG